MAKTIEQLKAQGAEVKNATVVGENTATRVGTLFNDIVEHVGEYEVRQTADTEANTQAIAKRGIYDVSAYNGGVVFESLQALLSSYSLSTLIPASVRCGGMSIRFIQGSMPNSDNNYIQARCISDEFTTDVTKWAIYDDGIYVENPEFAEVCVDAEGKILYGVKKDGDFYFGNGVPSQVQEELDNKVTEVANNKVDKEEGKSLINSDYASSQSVIENPEFIEAKTDADGKILEGVTSKGVKQINLPVDIPSAVIEHMNSTEFVSVIKDNDGKVIEGITKKGTKYLSKPTNQDEEIIKIIGAGSQESIFAYVSRSECSEIIHRMINNVSEFDGWHKPKLTTFLHFSDIHGDPASYNRIGEFYNAFKGQISDVICTGDFIHTSWADDFTYWNNPEILFTLGNHDVGMINTHATHPSKDGQGNVPLTTKEAYDRYFAPFIGNWGVVQPNNAASLGKCYWYKDYDNASKVRLIGFDSFFMDSDELSWLDEVLEDARVKEYAVIVAQHFPSKTLDVIPSTYNQLRTYASPGYVVDGVWYSIMPESLIQSVETFIDNGGEFICHLVGHNHCDYIGTVPEHANQLVFAVSDASSVMTPSEVQRVQTDASRDCFNVFSVDTENKLVKSLRVGYTYNMNLQSKKFLVFNYQTKEIIL